ncbi:hypothetical protein [Helicobacter sp.]
MDSSKVNFASAECVDCHDFDKSKSRNDGVVELACDATKAAFCQTRILMG